MRVEDLQNVELNTLIDAGYRFILKVGLIDGVDEFDKPEDIINGKVSTLCES